MYNNIYQQLNQYAYVNGIEGAKQYQIAPNQTMLLMDNNEPIVYMKTSNQLGQSSLRYFKLVEINEQDLISANTPYALKSDIDDLKAKLDQILSKKEEGDINA